MQIALAIAEALGDKAAMAAQYGNLGLISWERSDFDRAEEMYRKGLELNEGLGRKEGMANQYGNLGNLYKVRGELDRAEEAYRKSLDLFRQIGAVPQIKQLESLLADVHEEMA